MQTLVDLRYGWPHRPIISTTRAAEAGDHKFKARTQLQSEFQCSLSNLGRPCPEIERGQEQVQLHGTALLCMLKALDSVPGTVKDSENYECFSSKSILLVQTQIAVKAVSDELLLEHTPRTS